MPTPNHLNGFEARSVTSLQPQGPRRNLSEPTADVREGESPFVLGEDTWQDADRRSASAAHAHGPATTGGPWHLGQAALPTEATEVPGFDSAGETSTETEPQGVHAFDALQAMPRAVSPVHESLTTDELIAVLGDRPAVAALHWLLASREPQQAALTALLDRTRRRSIRLRGRELSLSSYLRLLSRVCREAAEQTEEVGNEVAVDTWSPSEMEGKSHIESESELPAESSPLYEEEARAKDAKSAVSNTFDAPYRWICKISLRKNGKYVSGGTGVLISDRHVLTAAHVVYEVYKNRAQFDLEVTPALNGNDDLGTYVSSSKPAIPDRYVPDVKDSYYDYALVTLDTAIGAKTFKELNKQKLCFWGSPDCGAGTVLTRLDPKSLVGKAAYTAGYPMAKGGRAMWWFSGLLHSVDEHKRVMWFTGEATEGQSGSPVWIQEAGRYCMTGILVAEVVGSSSTVVRITRELCRQLQSWISGAVAKEAEEQADHEAEQEQGDHETEQEAADHGAEQEQADHGAEQQAEHDAVIVTQEEEFEARRGSEDSLPATLDAGIFADRHESYEEQETGGTVSNQEKCKQDWLKLFNSLPDPLRQALTQKDFNNAIVIAIHHGWRDLDKLTDLIFLAEKGDKRGYCKLSSAPADAPEREFWRQKKGIVRSFMLHPSPPLAQQSGVQCRKVEFKRDVPKPDLFKRNLTGRYEYRAFVKALGAEVTSYILNINQAGRHIEGLMTRALRPNSPEKSRAQYRIYGDLQSDASFLVFSTTKPADFWGYLRTDPSGRLYWWNGGSEDDRWESDAPLVKYSDEPTLIESAFSPQAFSPDGLVHRQEWFPLTTTQKQHLVTSFSADRIAPFLERCFATPQGFKDADKRAVGQDCWKLWPYIEQVFMDKDKGVHQADRVLAIHYVRTLLALNRWTFTSPAGQKQTRSQLDWIQDLLDRVFEAGGGIPDLQNGIHAFLWLKPHDPNSTKYTYAVSASLKGVGLIGGYFRGEITIKNLNGKKWTEETFKIVLKGFQAQLGFSIDFKGTAETPNEWLPADFPGDIDLLAASAGAEAPGIKLSAGAAVMTIFGSGTRTPMIVTSQEAETGVHPSKEWGLEKPDLSGRWGEIRAKDLLDVAGAKVHVSTDHAGLYGLESDAHFCLGSALLTEDARQALRIVCANELRGFMNPQSQLSILGYADTVGYKDATAIEANERNGRLSLLRAENTLQAIRDILSDRFKIPEKNIKVTGEGQKEAEKAGVTLGVSDPRFRRVDVILNSALVISLRV